MRNFDYTDIPQALLTPSIVSILASIHEHKGKQDLHIEAHAGTLAALMETAKIQSVGSSSAIEGIHTTDRRLKELVQNKTTPRNRAEQEIAGYRDALAAIHEGYDYISPRPPIILQLHQQLYSFSRSTDGDNYKNNDSYIADTDASTMDLLTESFIRALKKGEYDPLLLIPMFILDFLCIRPFNNGNERMSRLLTLLLFYRAGYIVGKYISLEKLIERSKDAYYEALQNSSIGWHDNQNSYAHFIRYYLSIIQKAYSEFEERVGYLSQKGLPKTDRIRAAIDRKAGTISKKEIMEICPDISKITIERTLNTLVKSGYLLKISGGRTTSYTKANRQGDS